LRNIWNQFQDQMRDFTTSLANSVNTKKKLVKEECCLTLLLCLTRFLMTA
jgi:hypothetical protein